MFFFDFDEKLRDAIDSFKEIRRASVGLKCLYNLVVLLIDKTNYSLYRLQAKGDRNV